MDGRTKTEAFQNDHSMHVLQRKVRDAIVFHSLYRFRVEGQKRLAYATCVRVFFFENGEKYLRCQKFWIRVDMNEA